MSARAKSRATRLALTGHVFLAFVVGTFVFLTASTVLAGDENILLANLDEPRDSDSLTIDADLLDHMWLQDLISAFPYDDGNIYGRKVTCIDMAMEIIRPENTLGNGKINQNAARHYWAKRHNHLCRKFDRDLEVQIALFTERKDMKKKVDNFWSRLDSIAAKD